jgi:hypothetical protein
MLCYSNFEENDDCKDFPTWGCGGIGDVLHPFLQSIPPIRSIFNFNLKNNILVAREFLWGT